MRPTIWQSSISAILRFFNYLQIFVGLSIVLYSLWMLNDSNRHDLDHSSPWFMYLVMAIGGLMCLIALTGHVAAGIFNVCCTNSYAVLIAVFILSEAALMVYLIFNKHWEENLPRDPTGHLHSLREFVEANIDTIKWGAISLVVIQVLSLLLAILLRATIYQRRVDDDSDEEYIAARWPLLNQQGGMTPETTPSLNNTMVQPHSWSTQIREKLGLVPSTISNPNTITAGSQDQLP